jgi:hypothetical protein
MNFIINWKTSLAGVTAILGAIGLITKMLSTGAFDVNTITLAFGQIVAGVGILVSKDANVTGGTTVQSSMK